MNLRLLTLSFARLVTMSLLLAGLAGCACGDFAQDRCVPCYSGDQLACFGYYSTCWYSWPAECTTCPPETAPEVMGDSEMPSSETLATPKPLPDP